MAKNKRAVRFTTVASAFTGRTLLEDESKVLQDYCVGQRVGEGAYGSVYVAKYIHSGEVFALKILQKETLFHGCAQFLSMDQSILSEETKLSLEDSRTPNAAKRRDVVYNNRIKTQSFYPGFPTHTLKSGSALSYQRSFINRVEKLIIQEATVAQSLEHPHVVKVYKFLNSKEAFYFIMELAEGGELFDLILLKHYFSETEARYYFQQLISAIDYCHSCGVAHKDLKAENLLLDSSKRLLVCDFGFCSRAVKRNVDDPEGCATIEPTESGIGSEFFQGSDSSIVGTMHYMSPEAVLASSSNYTAMQPNFWSGEGGTTADPPGNEGFYSADCVSREASKRVSSLVSTHYPSTGAPLILKKTPAGNLACAKPPRSIPSAARPKVFGMSRYSTLGSSLRPRVKRHGSFHNAEATHADATPTGSPSRSLSFKGSIEKPESSAGSKHRNLEITPTVEGAAAKKNAAKPEPLSTKNEPSSSLNAGRVNLRRGVSDHLAPNRPRSTPILRSRVNSINLQLPPDEPSSSHHMSKAKRLMMSLFSFSGSAKSAKLRKGKASALYNPDTSLTKFARSKWSSGTSMRARRTHNRRSAAAIRLNSTQSLRKLSHQQKKLSFSKGNLGVGKLAGELAFENSYGTLSLTYKSRSASHTQDEFQVLHSYKPKKVIVDPFQQDLWSAGVLLFFMLTGRLPFDGRDEEETLYLIQNAKYSWTEEEMARVSPDARHLVQQMLALDPIDRPSLNNIIFNKWFAKDINLEADFPHRGEELRTEMTERGLLALASPTSCTRSASSFPLASISRPVSFLDFDKHIVTLDEEKAIDTAFKKIDADGYGKITRDQIRDMLTYLHGDVVGSDKVSELVMLFTGDPESKEITFAQFRDAWVNKDLTHAPFTHSSEFQLANIIGTQMDEVEREVVRQLRTAFDTVDQEHMGVIDLKELKRVFKCSNVDVNEEDIVSLIHFFQDQELLVKSNTLSNNSSVRGCLLSSRYTSAVGNGVCYVSSPRVSTNLYITFENFVMGITQRNILLRHPLGRKLAAATNLTALFHSRNVTECVLHGFLVVGLQNVVLEKLASMPDRLLLLYSDETVSTTENIYYFRYFASTAASTLSTKASKLAEGSGSLLQPPLAQRSPPQTNAGSLPNHPAPSISDFILGPDGGPPRRPANPARAQANASRTPPARPARPHPSPPNGEKKRKDAGAGNAKNAKPPALTKIPVQALKDDGDAAQKQMLAYTVQAGHTIAHRALAYAANVPIQQANDMCNLDIILAPACMGYSLVRFRRIHGNTSVFHEAVTFISNLLEVERQKAVEDTMPHGESELM